MSKTKKHIDKALARLCTMEEDIAAIRDHVSLLAVLSAQPDAETVLSEMNRLLHVIAEHNLNIEGRRIVILEGLRKAQGNLRPIGELAA